MSNSSRRESSFREGRERCDGVLEDVDAVLELDESGDPERVGHPVQVEARQLVEGDLRVEMGIGRSREHLDVVPERSQLAGHVARVDALTPRVGVSPVGEEGDAQRAVGCHGAEVLRGDVVRRCCVEVQCGDVVRRSPWGGPDVACQATGG
jgi:hypothetical protein